MKIGERVEHVRSGVSGLVQRFAFDSFGRKIAWVKRDNGTVIWALVSDLRSVQ